MSEPTGYREITCPFCGAYKHVTDRKLAEIDPKRKLGAGGVVCDDCWRTFNRLADKHAH